MFKRMLLIAPMAIVASPIAAQSGPPQPSPSAEPSVSVPREVLDRYVGRWEVNGAIANVTVTDDGRLNVQLMGQPPGPPLRTVSANEFVADAAGVRLIFEGDGHKATRIRSQYAGTEVIGRRLSDGAVVAQPGAPSAALPTSLDASARSDAVTILGSALRQRYVFPDLGERAAARIEAALTAGEYDSLSDPVAFAARLDADVSAIAHDKHLRINSMVAPPPVSTAGQMPMPASEAGVVRADKLDGGVGYVEVVGFPPPEAFKPVIDRAMTGLAGSKALIIDLRRNGGGSPPSVAYLSSFLASPGEQVHLNDIVSRVPGTTEFTRQSFHSEPTPVSFGDIPVYVLTSNRTFSGGEGSAYEIQARGRAKVIGEVTGGGANPTGGIPLGSGLTAGIPYGRAENPITKTNWEGRGVQPDIVVPAADALKVALERLGLDPLSDIAEASQQRVFAPRPMPLPNTEAAVRALVAGLASGSPDYASMSPGFADVTRQQLPQLQSMLRSLGELKSLDFFGPAPGGDAFKINFANGALLMAVMLGPDGKVVGSQIQPSPTGG